MKTTVTDQAIAATGPITTPRLRTILYWAVSAPILLETAVGAEWDLARIPFVATSDLEEIRQGLRDGLPGACVPHRARMIAFDAGDPGVHRTSPCGEAAVQPFSAPWAMIDTRDGERYEYLEYVFSHIGENRRTRLIVVLDIPSH